VVSGERYRVVTRQNGKEHVSSVVLGAEEVMEHLRLEQRMHTLANWHVKSAVRYGELWPELHCSTYGKERVVFVRKFSPMDDV
jgi:23S rRNA C2498 (ribose-2'-O)-methylase RlmM